jgi:hypothetical protein
VARHADDHRGRYAAEEGTYLWGRESRVFPGLHLDRLADFLHDNAALPMTELLRVFRQWLKDQKPGKRKKRKK